MSNPPGEDTPTLAELSEQLTHLSETVGVLAADVHAVSERLLGVPLDRLHGRHPSRSWLLLTDEDVAANVLGDLTDWLQRVWLAYPDASLPPCWLHHPALIEQLWALRRAHAEAYDPVTGDWARAVDWQQRWRPELAHTVRLTYDRCDLHAHLLPEPTREVPHATAQALQDTAHAWATQRTTPPLTAEQLHDGHANGHHRTNGHDTTALS